MDGGIRGGADVVKAMALGANAVLVGRPYVYALAVGGEPGVAALIEQLAAETDLTLALMGARSITDARRVVDRGVVLSAPGAVALEQIVVDEPEPGEVVVRIEASGVCHTDLHVVEEDGWGHPLPGPARTRGRRDGRGRRRRRRARRRRATASSLGWHTACGECAMCRAALPRRCKQAAAPRAGRLRRRDGAVLSPVLRTGTFATRTVVPAAAAVKMPDELPGRAGLPDRLRRRHRRRCPCSRRPACRKARASP